MHKFLSLSGSDRAAAIKETAAQMQLHSTPVEKDFWVCFLLRELFALECVKGLLIFKGGTSLSKGYGIIHRFSEDIDLTVHASAFGIDLQTELGSLGPDERKGRMFHIYQTAKEFIEQKFLPELDARLQQSLPIANWRLQPHHRGGEDFHILLFKYEKLVQESNQQHYTSPDVQIEIGIRAEHDPAETRQVQPYIAEQFPQLFDAQHIPVKVLSAKRTFWEKATIFHAESFKPADQPWPLRYARHAYDLHQLLQSDIGQNALNDLSLLKRVAQHKALFHPIDGVDYHLAHQGQLRILPQGSRKDELAADYAAMRDFFMSKPPAFADILQSLEVIEQHANQAAATS